MKKQYALAALALSILIGGSTVNVFAGSVEGGTNTQTTVVQTQTKSVDLFYGSIRMSRAVTATEQYAALNAIAPSALLLQLAAIVPNDHRLRAHLLALANDANNPTVSEFVTASNTNEIAFSLNGGHISTISPFRGDISDTSQIERRTIGQRIYQSSQTGPVHRGDFNVTLDGGSVSTTTQTTVGGFVFATHTTTVQTNVATTVKTYVNNGDIVVSPIVLDMTGKGKLEASNGNYLPHPGKMDKNNMVVFDYFNNGFPIAMEWVGPNDGLLVETMADGSVDGSSLFSLTGGWSNGYEELGLRDADGDKVLRGEELSGLAVWQDKNRNTKADEGEMQTVQDLKISEISLKHRVFKSSFVMDGKTHTMWDWWPSAYEIKAYDMAQLQEQVKY
jgi:hypothetical protein